jgi:hypothetical protein
MRSRASFTIGWTNLDGSLRARESTLLNKDGYVYLCRLSDGIGRGPGTVFIPCIWIDYDSNIILQRVSRQAKHHHFVQMSCFVVPQKTWSKSLSVNFRLFISLMGVHTFICSSFLRLNGPTARTKSIFPCPFRLYFRCSRETFRPSLRRNW